MGNAFLHGFGALTSGAAGMDGMLNFQIVGGTTKPADVCENTIWINTDAEITGWGFDYTEPETTKEGLVWITVGSASTGKFNAVTENLIQVYPLFAKQYIDGAWTEVAAIIYQNGVWVEWSSDMVIYETGVKYVPLTLEKTTEQETYLKLTLGLNGEATVMTTDPVNLTGRSTVTVEYSNLNGEGSFAGGIRVLVKDAEENTVADSGKKTSSSGTVTVDVTALNGEYFVKIFANNTSGSYTGSCRVSSIKILV